MRNSQNSLDANSNALLATAAPYELFEEQKRSYIALKQ